MKTPYLVCTLILCAMFSIPQSHASETIKIAYSQNYAVIKTPRINGFEGYGYEYIYEMLEYTQESYDIEFVPCTFSHALSLLETGEIDLWLPVAYSQELEEKFLFSQESLGKEVRFLASTDPDFILTGDYRSLQNATIAVKQEDVALEGLLAFLQSNSIQAEVVEIEVESFHEILSQQQYDYVLASSLMMETGLNPAFVLDSTPTYFLANQENQALLDDFDQAIGQIAQKEFMFQERYYLKYFPTDYNLNSHLSSYDYEFMKFKSVYIVGVTDQESAMAKLDQDGEFQGIYRDILDSIAQDIGVQFQYVPLDYESDESLLSTVDFFALPFGNELRYTMKQSDPLVQIPFETLSPTDPSTPKIMGTLSYYGLAPEDVDFFTEYQDLIPYDSLSALEKALESGTINSLFLTSSDLNLLTLDTKHLISTTLPYYLSPSISFSDNFPVTKIEILNKFIAKLNPTDLEYIVVSHSQAQESPATFTEILENNPIIINVFFGLLATIIFAVLWEEKSKKKALVRMLNHDDVTGYLTEHSFLLQAEKILSKNPDKSYCIVSLDVDNFKYINEVYSYEAGTKVLKEIADFLRELSPQPLLSARLFADVFVFFLETGTIPEQIQESLEYESLLAPRCNKHLSGYFHFSLSMGLYVVTDPSLNVNYMVDCANFARSLGKSTMGNTVHQFTEDMRRVRSSSNEILSHTDQALALREFVMYYQPKINLETGKLTGTEALVRWIREGNVVPPNDFIPLFEENGFIEKLDYYVLDAVCQFVKKNRGKKLPRISFNLSGFTVVRENLVENIMEVLEENEVSPSELDLEITESAFVENLDDALNQLHFLRDLGFTISMDDFGAGISSLGRLKEIPFDVLKIDREFIVDSLENDKGATIIRNVVQMAKDLQVETVAEGIETQEQLDFLKNLGCDVGQGYFFNRPLQEVDFLKVLHENQNNTSL